MNLGRRADSQLWHRADQAADSRRLAHGPEPPRPCHALGLDSHTAAAAAAAAATAAAAAAAAAHDQRPAYDDAGCQQCVRAQVARSRK